MEYTPSNLLRRITTPGQGYSEFHYGIDRQRVIRRDGNQAGVSRRVHYNGIIHMNGRIYDPHLARFLQADPFVEDPGTLNRYTYVHNNPLVYYDPSGYFSLKSFLKIGAAVAISFLGGQIIAGKIWASLGIKAGSAAAYGVAAAAGALSGYIMTGSLEGTLWGAFSAATFYGIGQKFGSSLGDGKGVMGSGYSKAELARATAAHGVAGGTLSKLQGGRFGYGLASAGITKVASPAIEFAANDNSFAEVTMATIAGGSISSISGGKFANGAVTAAMAYAFNQMQQAAEKRQAGMSLLLGEDESTEILTPKLMRVRMKLLRSEIKDLIVNLEEMTVDEFNKYIAIGPPGNYPELYEVGQASLVSYLKSIHIGLTARSE